LRAFLSLFCGEVGISLRSLRLLCVLCVALHATDMGVHSLDAADLMLSCQP